MCKNFSATYIKINEYNFNERSLDGFDFGQTVTQCWQKKDGVYALLPKYYTETRELSERRALAAEIRESVKRGWTAFAAVNDGEIIGFSLLSDELFGSKKQYADLAEFYVSKPFRRLGIGEKLFELTCGEATVFGAEKLYISAHSAKESIAAYEKYGCVPAEEQNEAHVNKEPCDLQLEFRLKTRIYIVRDKRMYFPLLLLADEQADMVEKYIERGTMFVLDENGVKGEILVTDEGGGVLEIKNLAVLPQYRKRGYGKKLIEFICKKYKKSYSVIQVGTGDSPLTVPFYNKCGFEKSHVVENFFTDNYIKPITEGGVTLKDMIYLRKKL